MSANVFAENAKGNLDVVLNHGPIGNTDTIALTHTQATLALAFEQRTTNLIAMYLGGEGASPGIHYGKLLKTIKTRLDLA